MLTERLDSDDFRDRLLGCWLGKSIGGTLGTPLESAWGQPELFDVWWYPEIQENGLPNDDLEMQLVWLKALEEVGPRLEAKDLAAYWLDHIGYNFDEYGMSKTNLRLGLQPPVSGVYNNWFTDCMGSPIRSEIWACVSPGLPREAARLAFEDAICDHAGGEGVYGELFNAALESAAFLIRDKRALIDVALTYIPPDCRTAVAVRAAIGAFEEGLTWQAARNLVLAATPSQIAQYAPVNLGFQVIGWLYGTSFEESLCITVNCGYDTDSSGGSVGAWLGIREGRSGIPEAWAAPFTDKIATNESWGGVRHLGEGQNCVPTSLSNLSDRIIGVARRIFLDIEGREQTSDKVTEADLCADRTIKKLWRRSPTLVVHHSNCLETSVDYGDGPVAIPESGKRIKTTLTNPHPDEIEVTVSWRTPSGWAPVSPHQVHVRVPPRDEVTLEWTLPIPKSRWVSNSNCLELVVDAAGWPRNGAIPVVLAGARPIEICGPFDASSGTDQNLLDAELPPEQSDGREAWRTVYGKGNRLPMEEILPKNGVAYARFYLWAERAMSVWAGVDASVPTKYWINGTVVRSVNAYKQIRPNYAGSRDRYNSVRLERGWNEVLIKFVESDESLKPENHFVISTDDKMHNGLPEVGMTRRPDSGLHV